MRKFIANSRKKLVAKDHYAASRQEPKSKFKSLLLGFSTGLAIVGIVVFIPFLPAIAKDIPVPEPSKSDLVPAEPPVLGSELVKGLAAFAGIVCAGAIEHGLIGLGIVCGLVVGAGMWFKRKSSGS